MTVIGIV